MISPAEVKEIVPIINDDPNCRYPILGAYYQPRGGTARQSLAAAGGTGVVAGWYVVTGRLWALPPATSVADGKDGQAVHYGVRPSDIVPASSAGAGVPATVIVVEPTGAETELLVEVGGTQLIAVIHGRTSAQPGETVYLQIDGASARVP
jgi:ABC-type sugar transport system ATPase subunit